MANEITDVESLALISGLRELDVKQFAAIAKMVMIAEMVNLIKIKYNKHPNIY